MEENKKEKYIFIIIGLVLIIVILLCFCGYFAFRTFNNPKGEDKPSKTTTTEERVDIMTDVNISDNEKTQKEVLANLLNGVFANSEIEPNVDYMNNYDFKFMFFVYLTSRYSENSELDKNGQEVTGIFNMNSVTFDSFYLKYMGEQFDISKLDKTSKFYIVDNSSSTRFPEKYNGNILSRYISGITPELVKFKYVKTVFSSAHNTNYDLFDYYVVNGSGADLKEYKLDGTAYLEYKTDPKGFTSYKSFKFKEEQGN